MKKAFFFKRKSDGKYLHPPVQINEEELVYTFRPERLGAMAMTDKSRAEALMKMPEFKGIPMELEVIEDIKLIYPHGKA